METEKAGIYNRKGNIRTDQSDSPWLDELFWRILSLSFVANSSTSGTNRSWMGKPQVQKAAPQVGGGNAVAAGHKAERTQTVCPLGMDKSARRNRKSRMNREIHVRIREGLGVRFSGATRLLFFGSLFVISSVAYSDIRFVDNFESGKMDSPTILALPSNLDGFQWSGVNQTSLVRDEWNITPCTGRIIWNGSAVSMLVSNRDWRTKSATNSMRFLYPAGDFWSEQRFSLGAPYLEVWFRYWIRVPVNFAHGAAAPNNHKFFAVWMDGYSAGGDGPTVIWEFWRTSSTLSRLAFHYSVGGYTGAGSHMQETDFIATPQDRGRWMQVILYVKAATNRSSNDGVIRMWRRWDNETTFTRFHELINANIAPPPAGPNGWKAGYLMGWANAAYAEDTEWLIDDFTVSTSSFLDVTSISPPRLLRIIK